MLKIFTFLLSVVFVSTLFAQGNDKEARVGQATIAPIIGGELDAAWDQTDPFNIELTYMGATGMETPTVGEPGDTYFKALWDASGVYILVYVADDDYYPFHQRDSMSNTANIHAYDNIEIFFDCNFLKEDGLGGTTEGNQGHYQFAPAHQNTTTVPDIDDGTKRSYVGGTDGTIKYDYSINPIAYAPNYFYELFIPWSTLKDKHGLVDPSTGFGFEVVVADNDAPGGPNDRERMVWSNNMNGENDSRDNMDDAGMIYLEGYEMWDCSLWIFLIGGDITVDNELLQIFGEACPDALKNGLKWVINEEETTAIVRVSNDGVVTPISNGVLKIKATSSDGIEESNEITINISGQIITIQELNWLVDGFNEMPNEDGSPNDAWAREDGLNNHTAFIEDGIFHFSSDSVLFTASSMKVRQIVDLPGKYAEEEFMIVFKMWAAEETSFPLVLEDRSNNWAYWGVASGTNTPNAIPNFGNSRWDLTVTTEPKWFKMHLIPSNIKENSNLDFSFQPGLTGVEIQMDSLYLIAVKDSELIDWVCCIDGVEQNRQLEALNVYPNPATDLLTVRLEKGNTTVAIYNSVGIKMEEIRVKGTQHVFDVSNYGSGLYFVKANNTAVKFVK